MASIPCALKVRHHGLKGTVKRVGFDADDLDSLFDEPKNSFASQAGLSKVILTAQSLVGVGSEEHDVERLQSMSNGFEFLLEMFNGDHIASRNVVNVDDNTRRQAPLQRDFVNSLGRLAL